MYFSYLVNKSVFAIIPKSCRVSSIGVRPGPISRTSIDLMKRMIPALLASKLIDNNPRNIVRSSVLISKISLTDWLMTRFVMQSPYSPK